MKENLIKVIIVDDHPVVLQGFEYILQEAEDIKLVGKFADAKSLRSYLKNNLVDIILMDINLPDSNGIDECAYIKKEFPATQNIGISNSER